MTSSVYLLTSRRLMVLAHVRDEVAVRLHFGPEGRRRGGGHLQLTTLLARLGISRVQLVTASHRARFNQRRAAILAVLVAGQRSLAEWVPCFEKTTSFQFPIR